MLPFSDWVLFAGAAFLLAVTPGPNILYLISRSICQGRMAELLSLIGIVGGFLMHLAAAISGLSALFLAAPFAYDMLKWAGAAYLLWLAWQTMRPSGHGMFTPRVLPSDEPRKLIAMGFLTSALNPKIAFFYLSLLPQFIAPEHGSLLLQSLELGLTQIVISSCVNIAATLSAAKIASWFARNPVWVKTQRYVMGSVLGFLGLRLGLSRQ